ncbi:hypothetical protein BV898_14004 [Hypsibius exemplaris]|uniref:F-box domain-containing protein n=1 Tax=Hypsibius exemplaris TaxID=2072580 RepID=A0A1W0W911_HYPEX|nr:hypothetical protein BV898_14004 [Hypsibius exemplaris]
MATAEEEKTHQYADREMKLVRCLLASEQALMNLKMELFNVREWVRLKPAADRATAYKPPVLADLPPEDLEEILRNCDFITRNRLRRISHHWRTVLGQRCLTEVTFLDWNAMYNHGADFMVRTVDWTEDKSDASLTRVKAVVGQIRHMTYNALGHGIRFRTQNLYKLDQCQLLRKFLANCYNLETLTMRGLPGMTWTHLTAGLKVDCPKLNWIYSYKCNQTVDILKPNYTYSPARRRIDVTFMAVSMNGDVAKNFDIASDALLWQVSAAERAAHVKWVAKYIPQLTGKALIWTKEFLRKRTNSSEPAERIDLTKVDYAALPRTYWLLDLTSVLIDNPVPGMVKPHPKFIYR